MTQVMTLMNHFSQAKFDVQALVVFQMHLFRSHFDPCRRLWYKFYVGSFELSTNPETISSVGQDTTLLRSGNKVPPSIHDTIPIEEGLIIKQALAAFQFLSSAIQTVMSGQHFSTEI